MSPIRRAAAVRTSLSVLLQRSEALGLLRMLLEEQSDEVRIGWPWNPDLALAQFVDPCLHPMTLSFHSSYGFSPAST